ncbi:hypothetical protein F9Y90_04785 (plasmid) [Borrelia miyamotoi]|uniref:Uncharacterized protein n=1 Tax=Borrelia miyamotoi TaxID=47466 RepID=A0A5P8AVB4_9SPIR|nr:hypothetical protein [Borrelia miyamotoi]QFP42432.1 hypothetical protein F9Y90_04785 [Borrelia miyamotoi]WAZ72438.1 hypothetical protein O5404_05290 [Borrelia miyamotoi]WVI05359.1 hypothetical protein F9Y91_00640 [Borrelia miyamotoi]
MENIKELMQKDTQNKNKELKKLKKAIQKINKELQAKSEEIIKLKKQINKIEQPIQETTQLNFIQELKKL